MPVPLRLVVNVVSRPNSKLLFTCYTSTTIAIGVLAFPTGQTGSPKEEFDGLPGFFFFFFFLNHDLLSFVVYHTVDINEAIDNSRILLCICAAQSAKCDA